MVLTCGRTEGPFRKMLEKARLLTRLLADFFIILLGVRAHQYVYERMSGGCNGLAWRGQAWGCCSHYERLRRYMGPVGCGRPPEGSRLTAKVFAAVKPGAFLTNRCAVSPVSM